MLGNVCRISERLVLGADGLPEAKEDAYTIEWLTRPLVVKEGTTLTAEIV